MPPAHHEREWPDKILFAGLLLLTGSLLGLAFDAIQLFGGTIGEAGINLAIAWPVGITMAFEAVAALAAAISVYHQSARYLLLGSLLAIVSLGFMLLVPLFAIGSLIMVGKARLEGEEITHDERRVHSSLWPDKAFAASLVLTVGGLATVLHAMLVMMERSWTWLPGSAVGAGLLTLLLALSMLWAARQCFHQRRPWAGWLGVVAGILSASFTVIGPLAGVAAGVLMFLADREMEFTTPAAV